MRADEASTACYQGADLLTGLLHYSLQTQDFAYIAIYSMPSRNWPRYCARLTAHDILKSAKKKRIAVTVGARFVGSIPACMIARERPAFSVVALDNLKRRSSELTLSRLAAASLNFCMATGELKATWSPSAPSIF